MLKEAEKERDAQSVDEGNDDGCYEENESQAEDDNATSEGQIENDSDAISTLKLQLELEKLKAKRVEIELLMQKERMTLSTGQSSDQAARSEDNDGKADVRHLFPRMSDAVDFDCCHFS